MRSFTLKLIAAACAIALLACATLVLTKVFHIPGGYADTSKYTAGGVTLDETVKRLDIHWTAGAVAVAFHAQDTVQIAETAPGRIPADGELRWWLDGDTLHVQYAKSGYFSFRSLDKSLTVTLPEGIQLDQLAIDATSADLDVPDLCARDVKLGLTSGDLHAGFSDVNSVRVNSTSGTVELSQSGAAERVDVSTTSGDILLSLSDVKALSAGSTSGKIYVAADEAEQADLNSTSGSISASLAAFDDLKIDSTSGDVKAALSSEPGYVADVKTTSGRFDYSVALERDGDSYSCGDGSGSLRIRTTSGNVLLEEMDKQ